MSQVYISIGNSDDKLTQKEWSEFCSTLVSYLHMNGSQFYGEWYSVSNQRYQNMVASAELADRDLDRLRDDLGVWAEYYKQDSIALMIGTTEFVKPVKWA